MIFNPEQGSQLDPAEVRVAAAYRSAAIIVAAIALSLMAFIAAGLLLIGDDRFHDGSDQFRLTLIVVAVLLALGSIGLRRTQFSASRIEAVAAKRGIEGLIKHLFAMTLVIAATAEGIGVVAILLARFGGTQLDVITLGLVAAVIVLSNFPRRRAWVRAVEFFVSARPGSAR